MSKNNNVILLSVWKVNEIYSQDYFIFILMYNYYEVILDIVLVTLVMDWFRGCCFLYHNKTINAIFVSKDLFNVFNINYSKIGFLKISGSSQNIK